MTYRKPFTDKQRQHAIAVYRSLRSTLTMMRRRFPPLTPQQREIAGALRDIVREFAETLDAQNVRVNVVRLNSLKDQADYLALQYAWLRISSSGRHDNA